MLPLLLIATDGKVESANVLTAYLFNVRDFLFMPLFYLSW